ncbi:MAG TPA: mechanosensitive ion channel domain-containing protein [Candidatus Methylomirabilis sp.]|nr:mechanosensitive ion channel domain-containing protein [Candidatus Methylomirabilis sp.]
MLSKACCRALLIATLAFPAAVFAADSGATTAPALPAVALATAPAEGTAAPATLYFFNREIITFRAPYLGYQPSERASAANRRIREALAKDGPGVVKITKVKEGLSVAIDGIYVFWILEGDLDADDGQTFDQARVVVSGRLEEAIAAVRQANRGKVLLRGLGLAGLGTLVVGTVVWVLGRFRLWARRRIDAQLTRRLHLGLEERVSILRMTRALGQLLVAIVIAVLIEEWLRFVLKLFPYTRPWAEHLTGYVFGLVRQVWAAIVDAVPGLIMVAIIAALAQLATRIVRTISRAIEAGRYRVFGIDADVVTPTRRIITAVIWLFALAMAYPYLPGSGSEAFKGLSVLVGVMVSLGASGVVSQAAGGFILTYSRALRDGEWVRIGDVEGAVVSVGVFSTKIRTYNDEEISIPNTVVLGTVTKNFSRPAAAQASLLETSVTIGYSAPWRQIHAMLLEAAARTAELEREPPPDVLQTGLSDFYVQYTLRARLRNQLRRPAVLSALNANVQDVFNEYGVQIMSPHYVFEPSAPVVVPKERWFEPPAGAPDPARTPPDRPST